MKIYVRAHDLEVKGAYGIIKSLISANAQGAQLVCYKSFEEIPKAPDGMTEEYAKEIGEAFKQADLSIGLIGAYFNPVHSDTKKVNDGIDIFCDYLRKCKFLGCNVVGSETGSYNDEPWIYHPKNRTEEALKATTDVFRKLCDYADKYDANVGIEGASGHVCYDVKTLDMATRLIDRENLKIIFDLYNFMDSTNYINYLEILAEGLTAFEGRIHCFHIKDCVFSNGSLKQCAVGKGDLDFDSILSMIKKYDENATLILEGTKKDDVSESIVFLKDKWENA